MRVGNKRNIAPRDGPTGNQDVADQQNLTDEHQDFVSPVVKRLDLFQAAELRRTVAEDKSVEKDIVETRTDLEESDIVSVYDGVDRDMFADNAAMTSAARRTCVSTL